MINILILQSLILLATNIFNARLARANLIIKTDFDAKLSSPNRKITQNKSKHLLVDNELSTLDTKISTLDGKITKNKNKLEELSKGTVLYFLGNSMFDGGDGFQAYLIFQSIYKYFKFIANTNYISSSKSRVLSDESIKPFPTSDNSLTPLIGYYSYYIRVKFNGSILRQPKVSYTHKKVVNIYIVYELRACSSNDNDPTSKNCLFGAVTLTKNADIDKYGHSGYGTGFDRRSRFSFPGGDYGQNVLIFGADMSSSAHINN